MNATWDRRRRRFCRLNLEVLEDRTLLSTFTVDRLTDTGDGSGLAGDLRYCITQAASGQDSIQFGVTGTINLSQALPELMASVNIDGPGAGQLTVQRSTGGNYPIFTVDKNAVVEISNLTIANGLSPTLGGGLTNSGTLTLDNVVFSGNSAVQGGGGIYNSPSGSLTISGATLSNNRTAEGSGGAILNDGTLTINQSTVSGNHGGEGAGLYNSVSATLTVGNCTISSNSGANDGGGIYSSGKLAVTSSTISGNTAIDNGGGILSAGTLTVTGTTISSNSISDSMGSAIDVIGGTVTISDTMISSNMAHSGFGTVALKSPLATLDTCTISNNDSGMSGGLLNNGTLTLSNSTVSGNTSGGSGAAAGIVNNGTLTVTTSTVSGNSGFAGGIWNSAALTISNSTVSGNSAMAPGVQSAGGIAAVAQNGAATVQLVNDTIANNTVNGNSQSAGQLLASRTISSTSQATIELHNTIVAGDGTKPNFFADTGGSFISDGHNLSNDGGGGFLTGPGDLVNTNPLLSPLQENGGPTPTMALLPGSPAIDSGDGMNAPAADQRGIARSSNGMMDIGAFESRGFTLTITSGDNQQTLVNNAFPTPLAVSVSSPFGEPVQGGLVTFTAPSSGSSASFPPSSTAVIDSMGQASVTAVADASSGSYVVMASANGAAAVSFHLVNLASVSLFLVTNTLDSGAGSLRQAILDADGTPGPDLIQFTIGTGAQTIDLASPLPAITQSMVIDGTSQPGYSGVPLIELNGAAAGPNANGLLITTGSCMVLGLVINRFSQSGIELLDGGGTVLEGNYLGTDVTGTRPLGNGTGLLISSSNNTIGGTAAGDGNVIAGNQGDGVVISNGTANVLQDNFIGTDPSGTVKLGNGNNGIYLLNASGNTIGGTADGVGNIIANNGNDGVLVDGGTGNAIQRNAIYGHSSGLGIELRNGGNDQMLFPILLSTTADGNSITITGLLLTTPATTYRLEFFANSVPNPSGFGEGMQFLGSSAVTTDRHGAASFTITLTVAVPAGEFIAATASDPANNTSAFSNCVSVSSPAAPPGGAALRIGKTGSDAMAAPTAAASVLSLAHTDMLLAPAVPPDSRQPLTRRAIEHIFSKRQEQVQADGPEHL
jgi:predicted outer membrane repeat protein